MATPYLTAPLSADTPTTGLLLEQRINIAYFKLAYQCMLPAVKALDEGKQDIDALPAVAIDRVVHHSLIIEFGKDVKSVRAEEAARRNGIVLAAGPVVQVAEA